MKRNFTKSLLSLIFTFSLVFLMNPVEVSAQSLDCNGDSGGGAFVDDCGNCVGGNTGDLACIPFSPTVSISISNTDCDSLTDLTVNVSQDANEPDMATSLFSSDLGSFDISNMSPNDIVGSAFMSVNGGLNTFNATLVVSSIISSNQAIIESQNVITGLSLGTFMINNLNPGVSITASVLASVADNNNVTSGNSQTIVFTNVFINPTSGSLTFTTTVDSELGDIDVQSFPFSIVCLCVPNSSTDLIISCDPYTWTNGLTYTSSNNSATQNLVNSDGCDSIVTLNLTINIPDGCTDSTQFNYDPNALCDDGSCIPNLEGCLDSLAENYYADANINDGSCVYAGCTDPLATNYDPTANTDDGSCIFTPTCPQLGDANCDGIVNLDDLSLVLVHWLQSAEVGNNGDVVGSMDGFVNLDDLSLVLVNWLQSTP